MTRRQHSQAPEGRHIFLSVKNVGGRDKVSPLRGSQISLHRLPRAHAAGLGYVAPSGLLTPSPLSSVCLQHLHGPRRGRPQNDFVIVVAIQTIFAQRIQAAVI